jgi:hypothetical protein
MLLAACNTDPPQVTSSKARVMPKSGTVWGRDLASGLGLQEWELCQELGLSDCIQDAHRITLGGVEPTRLGIDEPLPEALVSAPIAVDRVALSACGERYSRDQGGPAVIFGPLLDKDSKRSRRAVAEQLIIRLLSRHPSEEEVDSLAIELYDAIEPVADDLQRDWAIGACVVVATSTEALFY